MTPEPDDFDARFAELIRDEFGDEPLPQGHLDDSGIAQPELPPHAWKVPPVFSLQRAIEAAEPDDVDTHMPEPLPPPRPWTGLRLAGALLLGLGLLVLVAAVFGMRFESLIISLAGTAAVAGLVMLLMRVPRERHGSGPWDNGAQV
ncbi:MAG TPA: hypothetical protein VLR88_01815 [Propionibacteriaceae bacterium]|nr:hypothetical protein [Propionibacteriaceae bacterium]